MTNEIKAIFDVHNETVRINLNGETIYAAHEKNIAWKAKVDESRLWALAYIRFSEEPTIYFEAWF